MFTGGVDELGAELDFSHAKMFEHELRIENLEIALKNTLGILKVLVETETKEREQEQDRQQLTVSEV
jgi:hypothetical protein